MSSVSTQAPATGQSSYSWNYAYSGDELTGVCSPGNPAASPCTAAGCPVNCTAYGYGTGSEFLSTVLDSGPRSYWQLGEASGSGTTAADEVDANLGTTDGTYSNVTLGVAGPLAGSGETTAGFNGTSSLVSLPGSLITDSTDETIGLWFKGASSTASGVLFSYDAQPVSTGTGNHTPALYVGGNGELYGEFWDGSANPIHTSVSVDDGKWHYAVLTASSGSQTMYLDGKQVGSPLAGQIDNLNETVDTIGAGDWASWPQNTKGGTATTIGYFAGDIGQVAVYPHALGALAVTAQYAAAETASPELNQVTLPSGNTHESATYDATTDRVATYTDPSGGTWAIGEPSATGYRPTPDSLGEVVYHVTVTDPANRQDTYAYDMLNGGRLVSADNGVDPAQLYGYDAHGFLASVVNQDGHTVCMTNDQHGDVLTRTWYGTEPAILPGGIIGTVTGCGGSASSGPTCTSIAAPCTTFYGYAAYNAMNPLDPNNGELTSVRDGRSSSATDNTYLTSYTYNTAGQLTAQTTPPTTDFPSGRTTTYIYSPGPDPAYNAAGELTSQVRPVSSSSSITTSYGYDPAGNRTALTGGNINTTWTTYNSWNLPESVIEPATPAAGAATDRTWTTGYDADGRPQSVSQPGGVSLSYGYDPLGDLTSETGSGASASTSVQAVYNTDRQMTSGISAAGTDTFTYNPDGAQSGTSGLSGTSSINYNNDGLVSSETSPAGTASYTYDAADRLSTEADPLTGATLTWGYNADSQPASISYATGGTAGPVQSFGYDGLRRLTSDTLKSASGTVLASLAYGYDANGNVNSQVTGGLLGTTSTSYGYDQASRLTSATSGTTVTGYGYDGDGNLTQDGPATNTYNAQDQLVSSVSPAGTTNYSYTLNGELASATPPSGSATDYGWDASGELVSAGGVGYGYDSAGRLVTRTTSASTTSLSYLGTSDSVAADGSRDYSYTPSGSVTAAGTVGGTAFTTMTNQHGDVTATFSPTSTAQGLAGFSSYGPYGARTATGYAESLGYQGDYTDPSTGLVDMNARWYSPAAGAFASSDVSSAGTPIPFTTDGNPYGYADANPLTHTDPTGHQISEEEADYFNGDPQSAFDNPDSVGDAEAIQEAEEEVAQAEYQDYEEQQAEEEGSDATGYDDNLSELEYQAYEDQQAVVGDGSGGGGSGGGFGGAADGGGPAEAPAPPPPPQDGYANGDEQIPSPPKALLSDPYITADPTVPTDVTDGDIPTTDQITEHFTEPNTTDTVKGLRESPAQAEQNEVDTQASNTADNTQLIDNPTSEDGKPATPTADTEIIDPGNGTSDTTTTVDDTGNGNGNGNTTSNGNGNGNGTVDDTGNGTVDDTGDGDGTVDVTDHMCPTVGGESFTASTRVEAVEFVAGALGWEELKEELEKLRDSENAYYVNRDLARSALEAFDPRWRGGAYRTFKYRRAAK